MKKSLFTILLALVAVVASAQIKKPELMVVPSDVWCISNGYYTEMENMGIIKRVSLTAAGCGGGSCGSCAGCGSEDPKGKAGCPSCIPGAEMLNMGEMWEVVKQ